jgi:hypothetical protein
MRKVRLGGSRAGQVRVPAGAAIINAAGTWVTPRILVPFSFTTAWSHNKY